ncbi:MAG: HlyC/CorC family transporter [Parachlamydiaceae bacterium]|nr:HlyC/CorC family transporter [Parachlamydiaceae bacterium]
MDYKSAFIWLLLNFVSIFILGFYSMMEMACVSFNRVRLHYYVSKGQKRAILLNDLLHNSSRLFGTTLIMVNVAMFYSSEFAREFHIAIGISPDLAPLSQVLIVLIFGELAPMFAARSYSEHIAMIGVPVLHASARILTPILWVLDHITTFVSKIISGKNVNATIYLTQEELQKILEQQEEDQLYASDRKEFNAITSSIFSLRHKEVGQVMTPISRISAIASNGTIDQARELFKETKVNYLPIYHNERTNIVGIVFPRDLIRAVVGHAVREYGRSPWFVTQQVKLNHILKQFRVNNQEVALILDRQGYTIGFITLDDVIEEIFGRTDATETKGIRKIKNLKKIFIDRTFPSTLTVEEFYNQFKVLLDDDRKLSLVELMEKHLGYRPEAGESIYIDPFEISVKETSIHTIKTISVKNKIK